MSEVLETRAAGHKDEALWLLDRLVPDSGVNNLSVVFDVDGRLEPEGVRAAVAAVVARHPALRTVYVATADGLRRAVLDAVPVELHTGAVAGPDELTAFVARPFPFDGTPLVRAGLFRLGPRDVFCLAAHHLVFDTRSGRTVLTELLAAYEQVVAGRPAQSAFAGPAPVLVEPPARPESLAYWRDRLAGVDPRTLLLRIGTPEAAGRTLAGGRVLHLLSTEATAAVRRMQADYRAPRAAVLLGAYAALLAAHGAGPDLVIGSPVDVRPAEAAGAVGYHVNVLPVRLRADPEAGLRSLVRAARDAFLEALAYADAPVDDLLAELPRPAGPARNHLFRHVFNYVEGDFAPVPVGDLVATPLPTENGSSKFDLEFFFVDGGDRIGLRAVYGTEFLTAAEAQALVDRYEALLLAGVAAPDEPLARLRVWSAHDRAVIGAANDTAAPVPYDSVLVAVAASVAAGPDRPAVVDGDRAVSYRQLWALAGAVRTMLAGAGVRTGDVVAVAARRGPELAAAVLGCWLAGAAYLPVDPEHPAGRVEFQLADSGARVALVDGTAAVPAAVTLVLPRADEQPVPRADEQPVPPGGGPVPPGGEPVRPDPAAPAYLIYTSGSTGTPKGTLVPHRALANLVADFGRRLSAGPDAGMLWLTTFAFDISALELFTPLAHGGRVVTAPDRVRVDGGALRDLLGRHDVGIVQATPTTWRAVLPEVAGVLAGRQVLCGGEPAPVPLLERLLATGCRLHHVYGPTETTVWSTTGPVRLDADRRPDVGRPIANTAVTIVDEAGRDLPVGVRGELCIAGAGVALGYHRRPELTAQRFGVHPDLGRVYRTGDEARWRPDGTLELLGRADRQVKLRGNRIELGEVEAALLRHPAVSAAAVLLTGDASSDGTLVAFVVAPGLDPAQLWEHAGQQLPRALVPHEIVPIDRLPANANEKTDYPELARRAAALRPAGRTAPAAASAADPADPLLATLVGLWRELLEDDVPVDPDTHFFTSGGESLKGAFLVQRVEELTGIQIRLADLFAEPTPRLLAQQIRREAS